MLQTRELMFERLFSNALPGLGIVSRYFPVKNAANYSLLYLLLRIVTELKPQRVLELGCGQTTLLLDDLVKSIPLDIISVEHDGGWAERMQERVDHVIRHAPLVERDVFGHVCSTYGILPSEIGGQVDLIVVDGPIGVREKSRWGALQYIEELLGDDFVIVFDDIERPGEQETVTELAGWLDQLGREYSLTVTRSVKSQCVIASGRFQAARYF